MKSKPIEAALQLELGFAAGNIPGLPPNRLVGRSRLAPERAQWWFAQIRKRITRAVGRSAPARLEQAYLKLPAHRPRG